MYYVNFLSWAFPGAAWTLTDVKDLNSLIWFENECGMPQPSPTDMASKLQEYEDFLTISENNA